MVSPHHTARVRLDFTTRPARVLLAAIRAAIGIVVFTWSWGWLLMPVPSATLLGLGVAWALGLAHRRARP